MRLASTMKIGSLGILVLLLSAAQPGLAQFELADAAMQRNIEGVRNLLQSGADVNSTQADGATALHWAVYHNDKAMVDALLRAGADAGAVTRNGMTPMWLAATNGDAETLRALLDAGADPNEELPLGRTPLMVAARTGALDAINLLLDRGAQVEARESERGTTPLMWAANQGHAGAVALLIRRGADVSAAAAPAGRLGGPALGKSNDPRQAVSRQVAAILANQVLPDPEDLTLPQAPAAAPPPAAPAAAAAVAVAEADDDDGGGGGGQGNQQLEGGQLTPLIYAVRTNSLETVKVLLDAGADVNQVSGYGWSPLLTATQNRYYQLGRFLIDNGADVNIANNGGWTPLYLATDNRNIEDGDYPVREPDMDHLEYIRLLLEKGADPNARMRDSTETRTVFTNQWLDERGATAFLRASQSGDLALMRLLLQYGADPHIATNLKVTALQVAAGIGWVEGVTTEHSREQTLEAIQLLLELGIDPNIQADTGRVAVHGAAHKGHTEAIQLLVDYGAQLDIRDFGNTDNRGSAELAAHTWRAIDYADGLVRVGVQSAIGHPETAALIRKLMLEQGLTPPPENRTLDSICIVEVCSADYDPYRR